MLHMDLRSSLQYIDRQLLYSFHYREHFLHKETENKGQVVQLFLVVLIKNNNNENIIIELYIYIQSLGLFLS